jgi:hypothetical protein
MTSPQNRMAQECADGINMGIPHRFSSAPNASRSTAGRKPKNKAESEG